MLFELLITFLVYLGSVSILYIMFLVCLTTHVCRPPCFTLSSFIRIFNMQNSTVAPHSFFIVSWLFSFIYHFRWTWDHFIKVQKIKKVLWNFGWDDIKFMHLLWGKVTSYIIESPIEEHGMSLHFGGSSFNDLVIKSIHFFH